MLEEKRSEQGSVFSWPGTTIGAVERRQFRWLPSHTRIWRGGFGHVSVPLQCSLPDLVRS